MTKDEVRQEMKEVEANPHIRQRRHASARALAGFDRPEVAGRFGIRSVPTIVVTGPGGAVQGVWTSLPTNGEIAEAARRAKPG